MSTYRKHNVKVGDSFGHLKVLERAPDDLKTRSYNLKKRWKVRCVCAKVMLLPEYYMTRKLNPKTCCGCTKKTLSALYPREYRIWTMMHVRCYDPKHEAYKHYGGRGIFVCAEWHKDNPDGKGFDRFLTFVGKAPSLGHSIDRIDNNLGYQPYQADGVTRQLRWATSKEQRANQRPYTKKG